MRQHEIVVDLEQRQLLAQALLALAQRGNTPPHGGDMLTDGQVDALRKGGVDLPALRGQHVIDGIQRTKHDAVAHPDQASPAYRLDDLRVEQLWQGHPAGLGRRASGLTARELHPVAIVGQQGRQILPESIGEEQRAQSGANTCTT